MAIRWQIFFLDLKMRDEEKWREKERAAVAVARGTERRRGIKEVRQEKAKGKGNLSSCLAS